MNTDYTNEITELIRYSGLVGFSVESGKYELLNNKEHQPFIEKLVKDLQALLLRAEKSGRDSVIKDLRGVCAKSEIMDDDSKHIILGNLNRLATLKGGDDMVHVGEPKWKCTDCRQEFQGSLGGENLAIHMKLKHSTLEGGECDCPWKAVPRIDVDRKYQEHTHECTKNGLEGQDE